MSEIFFAKFFVKFAIFLKKFLQIYKKNTWQNGFFLWGIISFIHFYCKSKWINLEKIFISVLLGHHFFLTLCYDRKNFERQVKIYGDKENWVYVQSLRKENYSVCIGRQTAAEQMSAQAGWQATHLGCQSQTW